MAPDQILTAAQMRMAEDALITHGSSVDAMMQAAGRGAAEWVWRIAAGRDVTVLCGPGNNGGDGYVIAETLRQRGGPVAVVAGSEPSSPACRNARAAYGGQVLGADADRAGGLLVDCLFGTGLGRPLAAGHLALLDRLARAHPQRIAVDLPSGVDADTGTMLNAGLPQFDLTLALGAWKFAHFLMPASAGMGALRIVPIGIGAVAGAATAIGKPRIATPAPDAHKYTRGLLSVVGGAMPGAAVLASIAAQGAGSGYVRLFAPHAHHAPPDLVVVDTPLDEALPDPRTAALLIGPGLGRDDAARDRLSLALSQPVPAVIDADALMVLTPQQVQGRTAAVIATPHEGELATLERAFGLDGAGTRADRARALARASGMVIVAKGADTVVAAPDGRLACAPRASSWLSTAGTGDVLAGVISSRLATGSDAFGAACEGVWLHGHAARICGPAFTAYQLAHALPEALAACLGDTTACRATGPGA